MSSYSDLFKGWGDPIGEQMFVGSQQLVHEWVVPAGVTSICIVAIGAGGGGNVRVSNEYHQAGGGGALAWVNDIPVTPGEILNVTAGVGGYVNYLAYNSSNGGGAGGDSKVIRVSNSEVLCHAGGGAAGFYTVTQGVGGTVIVGNGGNGGAGGVGGPFSITGSSSGGGAGGYTGAGGTGAASSSSANGLAGSGGGGASGSVNTTYTSYSGGVFPFGEGASGTVVAYNALAVSRVGSLPSHISSTGVSWAAYTSHINALSAANGFGAGGGTCQSGTTSEGAAHIGGPGCVRIIWGPGRSFPSTNVDMASSNWQNYP